MCIPVPTTTPVPLPYITMEEVYAIFSLSPKGASADTSISTSFSTGTDSPVNEASWIFRLDESISRISAGTILPSSKYTMSPGTSSLAGTMLSSPLRSTRACGELRLRKAAKASEAFFSCTTPMIALTMTIVRITMASIHSLRSPDSSAAPKRISTITSVSCSKNIFPTLLGGDCRNSFFPYSLSLLAASASLNPSSEV